MKNWLISRIFAIIIRIKNSRTIPEIKNPEKILIPGDKNPEIKKNSESRG